MPQQESNKPNILFFHVDNVSVGDFGCYGGAYPTGARTPNIDRFADESLLLTNYNVEAQCTPSRSALMTGQHPVRTGCITALPGSGLVAWEVTIADKLKELGYSFAINSAKTVQSLTLPANRNVIILAVDVGP
jgi:arylsulfatase